MTTDSRWARAARGASLVAIAVVVLSLGVRFSVRDRVPLLGVFYFGTPLVLDALAATAAAVVFRRAGRKRLARFAAVLAVVCAALYVHGSFVFNDRGAPGAIRGVFWNVRQGSSGWPEVAETLTSFDADVMCLGEAGDGRSDDVLRRAFPQHSLLRCRGGLVVLVRGTAKEAAWDELPFHGRFAVVDVETKGRGFRTVFVDVGAHPAPRREPLGVAFSVATSNLAHPLLVVGDFNTPRDSAEFDEWRGPLSEAFETAGRGLDATWPVPVPVLSIDHVWAGGGLVVRTCELPWTLRSDHLPVVFTFDVP